MLQDMMLIENNEHQGGGSSKFISAPQNSVLFNGKMAF